MNEQQLRGVIQKMLLEEHTRKPLLEYGDDSGGALYKAFVSPFVDVLQSAKLTSQDILNSFKLIFKTLITISPKKLVAAREDYNKTKDTLDKEWAPLMKKARDSVENSDFGLITFAVAPNLFFGYQLAKFGADAPGTVVDYFEKAGWEVPLSKWLKKTPDEEDPRRGRDRDDDNSDGILKSLKVFFFGEAAFKHDGTLLIEQEKDKEVKSAAGLSKSNIADKLDDYFAETGFDMKLDDLAEQFIEAKKAHAESLKEAAKQQVNTLKRFAAANNIEDFEKAIEAAKNSGADVSEIQKKINELKVDITKKSSDLKKDPKFKEEITKKAKGKKLSDADIKKATEDAALNASTQAVKEIKKNVNDALSESFDQIGKQMQEELSKDLPKEGTDFYDDFAASPRGKEILEIIDSTVASIRPTSG